MSRPAPTASCSCGRRPPIQHHGAGAKLGAGARFVAAALLAIAAVPASAGAQDAAGTHAAVVLQLAPAPRPLALGGAYSAIGADELSLFYNPARLAGASAAIGLAYQTLPAGAGTGSVSAVRRLGPGVVAGGLRFLNFGEIDVIEPDPTTGGETGIPTGGRVGGGELALGAGYGLALVPGIQLGAGVKLLRIQLAEAEATGAAFDLGAGAELLDGRAVLGIAAQNLGGEIGPGRPAPLPRTIRGGVAILLGDRVGPGVSLAVEAIALDGEVGIASGVEAGIGGAGGWGLVGRVGYRAAAADDAQRPLVFGAGLALEPFTLDYAYRALGALGTAHLVGVTIRLSP